jgi:protein SCO1/2
MRINKRTLLSFLIAVLIIGAGVYVYFTFTPPMFGALIEPPVSRPNFTLASNQGLVSLSTFRGKLVVLYFGYTACPDVCPTSLANLRQAMGLLNSQQAGQVQVIFISVDWKRDTPEKLASYARAFHPSFIGLTGSQAEIDSVTRDFGIFYLLNEPDPTGYYSVDHTASTTVLDRQGNLVLQWPYGLQPSELASDLKVLLRR